MIYLYIWFGLGLLSWIIWVLHELYCGEDVRYLSVFYLMLAAGPVGLVLNILEIVQTEIRKKKGKL